MTTQSEARNGIARGLVVLAALVLVATIVVGVFLWRSADEDTLSFADLPRPDPGPVHVHGLGVNPDDDALFIATHTGLYRVGDGERKARRVGGDRYQDTMGFTIVGPNRFLGSGHPDVNEAREKGLPPLLGLIESDDAGETWESISLLGESDFHVLRSAGRRVYGYDASNDRLLTRADEGRTWNELEMPPGPLVDVAVDPADPRRLVATVMGALDQGMYESREGGQSWKRLNDAAGLLAWPVPDALYLIDGLGKALVSTDGGRKLRQRGEIGGEPSALLARGRDELYVALHDGTIKRSTDGGAPRRRRPSRTGSREVCDVDSRSPGRSFTGPASRSWTSRRPASISSSAMSCGATCARCRARKD